MHASELGVSALGEGMSMGIGAADTLLHRPQRPLHSNPQCQGLAMGPICQPAQELFLDVLGSTATKREAKSYLSRFRSERSKDTALRPRDARKDNVGVNLGNLYLPARAVDESPVFLQGPSKPKVVTDVAGLLHTALVKLRNVQTISDEVLRNVGLTLLQLSRLGMSSVVIVDCGVEEQTSDSSLRRSASQQADRIAAAIDYHGGQGARRLENVLTASSIDQDLHSSVKIRGEIHITNRNLILTPLARGKIPVMAPIAYAPQNQTLVHVSAHEVSLALARDFAGLRPELILRDDPHTIAEGTQFTQKEISLDRIILLDPLGGIPSYDKNHQSHVFINLDQEYETIKSDLSGFDLENADIRKTKENSLPNRVSKGFTSSNPISALWENQSSFGNGESQAEPNPSVINQDISVNARAHLKNLELFRDTLAILPPSSSGLLTTPENAANWNENTQNLSSAPGVGTRRQRNALIHNLLTDKPVLSSSLPSHRTRQSSDVGSRLSSVVPATFVKRGMPVSIIPDPQTDPWRPPSSSNRSIDLSDPRIDLPRLIHLIEDSFNRKLDVPHYLSRIKDRIAGIIIAGEYEGGALLTWESPSHNPSAMVPYLDKFAVLKRSQGAGGVADIVFKAMVRDCFPGGVCWRSRGDNPVNKWYFERAKGTWKIPQSNWTIFWTTEKVELGEGKGVFGDYESVCRSVVPSWADKKGVID
ncbi:MAG: hypothetical protein Q9222_004804 [Ikaeria aurantiellina]